MCKIKHAARVTKMALDYLVFHFSVLASPLTQMLTNIIAVYEVPTKGCIFKNAMGTACPIGTGATREQLV